MVFFVFSSRRRHTRLQGDWSSDVCSSDLALREGGSLPGLMEADDLGTYVVKFHGAGQGRKALVAEVISAQIGRACGLPVPDLVAVDLDPGLASGEPDQEI